jgi:hypothetical protein
MGFYFQNTSPHTVWITYAEPVDTTTCGLLGDPQFLKRGWYVALPQEEVKVWSGWASGKMFFWYAEDNFGTAWAGDYPAWVRPHGFSFEWCWSISASSDAKQVRFRKEVCPIYGPIPGIKVLDYTVTLTAV